MLEEVTAELLVTDGRTVPRFHVHKWMASENADIMGATYEFLWKPEHVERVVPPLQFDEVFDFMLHYYEFCLKKNPTSEWANSSYSAGTDLVGWFVSMWDEGRDKKYLKRIKSHLADLYTSGSAELKKCIEHAIIEHLFERKPIRKFFSDWQDDPRLRPAFEEGMLWIKGGGRSPLTER